MRCQLHLSSQYIFSSPFSVCPSLSRSVAVFVGLSLFLSLEASHPFPSIFTGLTPITVDFSLVDARVCSCVLFKDRVPFSNLGFCSVWLAGGGVPFQFSTSRICIFIMVKTQREEGKKNMCKRWNGHCIAYRPGKGRI